MIVAFRSMLQEAFKGLHGHWLTITGLVVFGSLLNGSFTLVDPLLTRAIIDKGIIGHDVRLFAVLAIATAVLGIGYRVASRLYELFGKKVQNQIAETVILQAVDDCLKVAPYGNDQTRSAGYYVSRIYDEPVSMATSLISGVSAVCVSGTSFVAAMVICVYLSWQITVGLLCIVPLLLYLANHFAPQLNSLVKRTAVEEAEAREVIGGVSQASRTIQIFSLAGHARTLVRQSLGKALALGYDGVKAAKTYDMYSQSLLTVAEVLVFITSGYAVAVGNLTIGGLLAFMNVFWKLISAGRRISLQYSECVAFVSKIHRIHEFGATSRAPVEYEPPQTAVVECDAITVKYDDKLVLGGLDISIGPTERILLTGSNGSGKSTFINLIAQFLTPSDGRMRVISVQQISAALSPFYFLPGSVKDNLQFDGLTRLEKDRCFALAREMGIDDCMNAVSTTALSDGQRKKMQILMALLKDADLYLLDEPLAHLDIASKEAIIRMILRETSGRALCVTMHGDKQFWQLFDRVLHIGGLGAEEQRERDEIRTVV
ncbi:ATP-binding cassette domain-containing protein [Silvibacterium sp.]|uniref:ATP-binding cassette domain-containing protein n=1 Tax=Silvibacterium sp. TaxID=1964179 RepID=UPI0039E2CFEE